MKHQAQEIVAITVPVLLEVVAIILFIGMLSVWAAIGTGCP